MRPLHGAGIHQRIFGHHSSLLDRHAAALPHVHAAFPALGLLRRLRPTRALGRRRTYPSRPRLEGMRAGNARGRFPRSLLSGRRVRHPAMPLRHRHGYAADFHRGLPTRPRRPGPEFPTRHEKRVRTANQPISARFELVGTLRGFTHWFLAYTFPSRSPGPAHLAVPSRPGFVGAAPALPGVPRIRLPPASPGRCDRPAVEVLSPPPGTGEVDPERPAGVTTGGFLRVASRTRRAPLSAPGSPQAPRVGGSSHAVLGHGVGICVPR